MNTVHHVSYEMATGGDQRDTSLAERVVDAVVEQGSQDIPDQGREKHKRDDRVGEIVKGF